MLRAGWEPRAPVRDVRKAVKTSHADGLGLGLALLLLLLLYPVCSGAQRAAHPVLHGAGTIHDLSRVQGIGVHASLRAVVTYYDASEHLLFVQDRTGGIFVNVDRTLPIAPGDLLSIEGSLEYGYRAGIAEGAAIRVLGHGRAVAPTPVSYPDLATGRFDCRLVRVAGVIKDAVIEHHPESESDPLHLDIALDSGDAEVYVHVHPGVNPLNLLGKQVLLTAVAGGSFDANQQMNGVVLYGQTMRDVLVEGQRGQSWATLPLTAPDALFSAVRFRDSSPQLRVRGTVVYFAPGELAYLQQGEQGILVQTRQTGGVKIGDVVDAYGFPSSRSYVPSLREAVLSKTPERGEVTPVPLSYEQAITGRDANRLISIVGQVLSQQQSAESSSLALEVGGHVVRVSILNGAAVPLFALGSRVRATGICQIVTGGPWREPVSFSSLARSAADLALLQGPSWWSTRHLAELLGALLGVSLLVITWAVVLHRRVVRQAKRIERSMLVADRRSAVLKQIGLNPPLDTSLAVICETARELLPRSECWFDLKARVPTSRDPQLIPIFQADLPQGGSCAGEFVICMARQPLPQEGEVLAIVRELLMLALNNAALHQQLMHRSTHDSLTDLPNRRLCEQRLDQLLIDAEANAQSFSVLYVDVNRFKAVNDRHGHRTGDCYLQAIARRLLGELRAECTVARVGGDEFLILLPGCDGAAALPILKRLKGCFAEPFALGSVLLNGDASFGLASFPQHGRTREALEQHADNTMYYAKFGEAPESRQTARAEDATRPEQLRALGREGEEAETRKGTTLNA